MGMIVSIAFSFVAKATNIFSKYTKALSGMQALSVF